jgi:hypothetical protein
MDYQYDSDSNNDMNNHQYQQALQQQNHQRSSKSGSSVNNSNNYTATNTSINHQQSPMAGNYQHQSLIDRFKTEQPSPQAPLSHRQGGHSSDSPGSSHHQIMSPLGGSLHGVNTSSQQIATAAAQLLQQFQPQQQHQQNMIMTTANYVIQAAAAAALNAQQQQQHLNSQPQSPKAICAICGDKVTSLLYFYYLKRKFLLRKLSIR